MNLQEEIRKVAYELYEKSGCRGGRDLENWVEAERIVMARLSHRANTADIEPAALKKVIRRPVKTKVRKAASQDKKQKEPEPEKPKAKKVVRKKTAK